MNKYEIKPYTEIIKENIDVMVSCKTVEDKTSMAEEIIYSVIKLACNKDSFLQSKILVSTQTALIRNLKHEADI